MPERPTSAPLQLPLFAEEAPLVRIRPERNEWRYHRLAVWADLFGRTLWTRQSGPERTGKKARGARTRASGGSSWGGVTRHVLEKAKLPVLMSR